WPLAARAAILGHTGGWMEIDLHGYDPRQIVETDMLAKIVQQAWEMGEPYLRLIHGHGRMRGISPGFVNTNTGFFGLQIRRALRHDEGLSHSFLTKSALSKDRTLRSNTAGRKVDMTACPNWRRT